MDDTNRLDLRLPEPWRREILEAAAGDVRRAYTDVTGVPSRLEAVNESELLHDVLAVTTTDGRTISATAPVLDGLISAYADGNDRNNATSMHVMVHELFHTGHKGSNLPGRPGWPRGIDVRNRRLAHEAVVESATQQFLPQIIDRLALPSKVRSDLKAGARVDMYAGVTDVVSGVLDRVCRDGDARAATLVEWASYPVESTLEYAADRLIDAHTDKRPVANRELAFLTAELVGATFDRAQDVIDARGPLERVQHESEQALDAAIRLVSDWSETSAGVRGRLIRYDLTTAATIHLHALSATQVGRAEDRISAAEEGVGGGTESHSALLAYGRLASLREQTAAFAKRAAPALVSPQGRALDAALSEAFGVNPGSRGDGAVGTGRSETSAQRDRPRAGWDRYRSGRDRHGRSC